MTAPISFPWDPRIPFLVAGAACVVTALGSYLCTRPSDTDLKIFRIFDRVREACSSYHESFVRWIGERNWKRFHDLVLDNCWKVCITITILILKFPTTQAEVIPFFEFTAIVGLISLTTPL